MVATIASLIEAGRSVLGQAEWLAREAATLARAELGVASGRSTLAPDAKDRRFRDPAWETNPLYRRLAQGYLAIGQSVDRVVARLEADHPDDAITEQTRFLTQIAVSAMAPTNTLWGNPAALKKAFDTGGNSLARGLRNWVDDLRHNGGMPTQTDRAAFTVGEDLAVTPGAVVHRHELAELIHYAPTTEHVATRPVLVIPPPIGRFYFLDLRPERSFVEYAVSRGLDVYLVSWRNPTPAQADWDLEAYAAEILRQVDVVREISGSQDINTIGFCAGGIIMTAVLNHLAANDDTRVHAAAYAVTLLDYGVPAPIGAFSSPRLLQFARHRSRRKGLIPATAMGAVFSWMRPDDLVFNYLVNNWLLGNDPPAFDILAWNADGTNLPARLHEEFLDIFEHNTLCTPGAWTILGTPLDLSRITLPIFVTGGDTDHLTPWRACYRTTQLLGSRDPTFVLSNAGHIASLINPPGNPSATYHTGPEPNGDADAWLEGAEARTGSWWEIWADWALEHGGDPRPAPTELGSKQYPVLDPAPGLYVHDLVP